MENSLRYRYLLGLAILYSRLTILGLHPHPQKTRKPYKPEKPKLEKIVLKILTRLFFLITIGLSGLFGLCGLFGLFSIPIPTPRGKFWKIDKREFLYFITSKAKLFKNEDKMKRKNN
jgi:hypothetical protein